VTARYLPRPRTGRAWGQEVSLPPRVGSPTRGQAVSPALLPPVPPLLVLLVLPGAVPQGAQIDSRVVVGTLAIPRELCRYLRSVPVAPPLSCGAAERAIGATRTARGAVVECAKAHSPLRPTLCTLRTLRC